MFQTWFARYAVFLLPYVKRKEMKEIGMENNVEKVVRKEP